MFYSILLCFLLFRIDLAKPDQPNQIELGRKDDTKVYKLFLDPTGESSLNIKASADSDFHVEISCNVRIWLVYHVLCHYVLI